MMSLLEKLLCTGNYDFCTCQYEHCDIDFAVILTQNFHDKGIIIARHECIYFPHCISYHSSVQVSGTTCHSLFRLLCYWVVESFKYL